MNPFLDIADSSNPGYNVVWRYGSWRLAISNDGPGFHLENIHTISKHMETDETFTLLAGSAFLHYGDGSDTPGTIRKVALEQGKTLVVRAGTWHAVETGPDAKILIAENADTGPMNTVSYPVVL